MIAGDADDLALEQSRIQTDSELTAEQGRMFEDLSVKKIEQLGLRVVDRQVSLPDNYPVSGHPDGRLQAGNGDDRFDGVVWGWEHKHLGRYAYTSILKRGLQDAEPQFILQSALYGDALGWDAAYFTIVAQDSSAIRGDITMNLRTKTPWANRPGLHPKVTLVPVDLRPLYNSLIPMAHNRARWLSEWKARSGDPAAVAREFDPNNLAEKPVVTEDGKVELRAYPTGPDALCGYCPFLLQCRVMGQSGDYAPPLPFTHEGDEG